jgi:DNA invertase Pin-like site-specific DNA recombinase
MHIGYARSSTIDQEAGYHQIKTLKAAGCEKVFSEKVSSVGRRDQLEAALDYAREGDALVVTKLDRLARSVFHLVAIGERLESKGVALKVLEQAIDTSTSTGRLMFNMLGAIAQFERELCLSGSGKASPRQRPKGNTKGERPPPAPRLRKFGASVAKA